MARFGRVITAMVTPFDDRGGLDLDAAARLAQWLTENGSDGLVLAGTTGEGPVLGEAEVVALTRRVREAVSVPILVGTGTNDTAKTVELTKRVSDTGIEGVLVVTPYYSRPSQAGLVDHFGTVAASTHLDVVLYDIPVRTGRKIAQDTLLTLAREVTNIVAVKDAAHDVGATARLAASAPDSFEIYSGEDDLTLPITAVGGVGVISVASHWVGQQFQALFAALDGGDLAEAQRQNARMLPSFAFEGGDETPNPIPTKAMLRVLGLSVGQCRPPMGPAPSGLEDRARAVLAGLR
ncbi:MAG: 4-hydroxy-tetrahydrodipicolinate synthase [Microthrixaceae bacterium]